VPFALIGALLLFTVPVVASFALRSGPLIGRRVLRLVAGFAAASYLGRGLYLAIAQPPSKRNDPMPIDGLYQYGYTRGLTKILLYEAASLATVVLLVWLAHLALDWRSGRHQRRRERPPLDPRTAGALGVLYAIGWVFRIRSELSHGSATSLTDFVDPPLAKVQLLALIVPAVLLLLTRWWERGSLAQRALAVVVPAEIVWTVVNGSKTPALALIVGWYLGRRPPDPAAHGLHWRRYRAVAVLGLAVVLLFSFVNAAREERTNDRAIGWSTALGRASEHAVTAPGSFLGGTPRRVLVRLDGLAAATQAFLPPAPRYLSWTELGDAMVDAALPGSITGDEKESAGLRWANRMAGTDYRVSLAEGLAAEGYAIGRVPGMLLWSIALAVSLVGVGWCLDRSSRITPLSLAFAGLVVSPVLFERGVLGLWESLVDHLEVGLIGWAIAASLLAVLRLISSRTGAPALESSA
jgi:hypothetical protein